MNTKIKIDFKTKMMIFSVVAFLITLIGVSFAWLRSDLASGSANLFVGSAGLTMSFHGTDSVTDVDLAPGEKFEKYFEVENVTAVPQAYNILWTGVTNTLVDKNYFMYTLEDTTTGEMLFLPKYLPTNSTHIAYNISLPAGATRTYKLTVYYIDDPKYNQLQNANLEFIGLLSMDGISPERDSHEVLNIFVNGVYSEYLPTLSSYSIDTSRTFCTDGASIAIVNNDIEISNQTDTTTCDLYLVSGTAAPITHDPYNLLAIDLNGGTSNSIPQTGYRYYGDIIELGVPEKNGYAFMGWEVSGNASVISENTKLTMGTTYTYAKAKWVKGHWNKVVQTCTQGAPATYTRDYKVCEENLDNYTKVEKTCGVTSWTETRSLCGVTAVTKTTYTCGRTQVANCSWLDAGYDINSTCSVTSPACTAGATRIDSCTQVYSGSCACYEKQKANCDSYCNGDYCQGDYCVHNVSVSAASTSSCSSWCSSKGFNAGGRGTLTATWKRYKSSCSCTYTYKYEFPSSGTTVSVSPGNCTTSTSNCSTSAHYNAGNTKVTCGTPKTYGWVSSSTRTNDTCSVSGSCSPGTSGNTYTTGCSPKAYNFGSPSSPTTVASCTPNNIACSASTINQVHRTCTPNYSYDFGSTTQDTVDACSVSSFACTENTIGDVYTTTCTPATYNYGYEPQTIATGSCFADTSHNTCTSNSEGQTYISACELIEDPAPEYIANASNPREVKIGTEEFYVLNDIINYTSLMATNGNIYNYASNKTILLAKYNLYVGQTCTSSSSCTPISTSATGYGLQSSTAKGYVSDTSMIAVVPFNGSSTSNGYWYDTSTSTLKAKYGSSYDASNIYDVTYNTAPNYSVSFSENAGNENYSIAYYVQQYINTVGANFGRLLTYTEANAMTQTQRTNGAYYWLGSANNNTSVRRVYDTGSFGTNSFYGKVYNGVRPVIIIDTAEIKEASS